MPTAPVDSIGNELFFTDSGAPAGTNDYTTLVIWHGSAFNGRTFHKLIPLALTSNIRLVVPNLREYVGSTKYSDEEMDHLKAGRSVFMESLGSQTLQFLAWFADKYNIPRISSDGKTGGICVMGWSMGAVTALSILGQPDAISKVAYKKLEPFLKRVILYDPAPFTLGYDFRGKTRITGDFVTWVTSYYINPDPNSSETSYVDSSRHPSIENITPEEMQESYEIEARTRFDVPFVMVMGSLVGEQARKALYDEDLVRDHFPAVDVVYLHCMQTMWEMVHCKFTVEGKSKELRGQGRRTRPIRFIDVEKANHFAHLDMPETFWSATVKAIVGN